MRTSLPRPAAAITALALAVGLAACAGGGDVTGDPAADAPADAGTDDDTATGSDQSDETSMLADDDVQHSGEVSQGEAEAVGTAYVGLTVAEANAQAEIDGRVFRIGEQDGEAMMLTEDYVLGRVTATVVGDVVTEVVVEASDGPVTVR